MTYFEILCNPDLLPDGRIHAKLMDPDWQAGFRLCVHTAYDNVREWIVGLRVDSTDHLEQYCEAVSSLGHLRAFLVNSARDAGPCDDTYAGPAAILDAYESACRMLTTMKKRLDSGQNDIPIKDLALIHAKLNGEDPAKLVMDADELMRAVSPRLEPPPPPPKAGEPTEEEKKLVLELKRLRWKKPAALVEFMVGRDSATAESVGEAVHEHEETSEDTIGANCRKINPVAERLGISLRYHCWSAVVFKEPPTITDAADR